MIPQIPGIFVFCFFFFFVTVQVYRDRELSIATKNPCCAPTSCRDNPCSVRSTLSSACLGLVVCAPRALSPRSQALSCQLCRDPDFPCRNTIFMLRPNLSRDLEYQFATWEPPPIPKLCRDMKFFVATMSLPITTNPCRNIKPYVVT